MLKEYRRALHAIPELDIHVPKTAAYVRQILSDFPCQVLSPWGDAVCAYFDFGKEETLAFRCDMDALPIREETGLPFASCHPGRMHACGHDGHMAILLGLAAHLAEHPARENVLLIFQPAEETIGGAREICLTGLLETYKVKCIFGLHLWPMLPKHQVASRAGGMMARASELTVEVFGRSVHIAKWQDGKDALAATAEFIQKAYALNAPCLLRFGKLTSGSVRNAVSDYSRLEGSLRGFDDEVLEQVWQNLQTIAAESECDIRLHRSRGYPPVCNDATLLEWARTRYPVVETEACFISEDFSEYQLRVPGVFFFLGTGGEPLHSPKFDFDEAVLETGLDLFRSLL